MTREADYIIKILAKNGKRHVFMGAGGSDMHLNDAFGRKSKIKKPLCCHEQFSVIAAENRFGLDHKLKRN